MIKKHLLPLLLAPALLLQGCTFLGGVGDSLTYTNEAVAYINEAASFSQQLPDMAQQAISDPAALEQFKSELQGMQGDIAAFKDLQAPAFAEQIDQKLTAYSDTLSTQISGLLEQAEAGAVSLQALEQSQIMQTTSQITQILEQVKQLGS